MKTWFEMHIDAELGIVFEQVADRYNVLSEDHKRLYLAALVRTARLWAPDDVVPQ